MDEKQAIMVKMLELQHLFGKQTDVTAQTIVLKIKPQFSSQVQR